MRRIQIRYVAILKFPALDFPISISAILYPLFIFTLYTNPLLVAHLNALLSACIYFGPDHVQMSKVNLYTENELEQYDTKNQNILKVSKFLA